LGLVKGVFSENYGWRVASGLTSSQSLLLGIQNEDSLSYATGDTITAYRGKNFDPYNFTLVYKIQHYTTGQSQYYFDYYGSSGNRISSYLSGSTIYFKYIAGGVAERSASITPTIVQGNTYFLVLRADKNNTIDGTNYLKINFGQTSSTNSGGTSSVFGTLSARDATFSIGQTWRQRGQHAFQGRMWCWFLNYAMFDSEVDSIYSGLYSEPICSQETTLMFTGAVNTSLLTSIYYDSLGATHSETFESGISTYTGMDATLSDETTNPLADAHSLSVAATTYGGYGYKSFTVSPSTTYNLSVLYKGLSTEIVGILVEGNVSGTLYVDTYVADGNFTIKGCTFTTGASDTSVEVRFFDDLDDSQYFVNGEFCQITDVNDITGIDVNDMV